jgi:gallate dioxygenase
MAKIIGALASSHTPTIGFAFDRNKRDDPAWAPIFKHYEPLQQWIEDRKPDVMIFIFNDHVTTFFFDHYSAFTLGVGETFPVADEGGGARDLPPAIGHPALARHIGQALMADEFDMSFFQDKPLDHGLFSPLSMLARRTPDGNWPAPIIPLVVGVLQFPIPSARRCYKLGQSLRRAIESYPEDLKVALVATGGLSHQVHGERSGFNNTPWDLQFLELIEKDPERLCELTHAEYAEYGGFEGSEVIMWLVMRGAMSSNIKKVHQSYYLPSMTAIATAIYENEATIEVGTDTEEYRHHMGRQLDGVDRIPGTYPFTLERSVKAYRLNKFLHDMVNPEHRKTFLADPEASFKEAKLTEQEKELVRSRDWRGMIHYGVIFFMLEKLGAVVGVSNLHIYAAMRGESLEEFQKTRNAQIAYSVAGKETVGNLTWDKK